MERLFLTSLILAVMLLSGCMSLAGMDNLGEETAVEICTDVETGNSMSYWMAAEYAEVGECLAEAALMDEHWCNENSGTWWIGLDIDQENCSPACVVDVNTGDSEINWMCTGLLED